MNKKVFFLVLAIAPFLLISVFNHPSLDDYWNANTIISHGRLNAISFAFDHFSGRYFSTFIMCLLNTLPAGEIWIFKLFPILLGVGLVASLYYFMRKVIRIEDSGTALTCALIIVLLYILNMRVLYEGLYWMSSTVCYQAGLLIYLILISVIFSYVNNRSVGKALGIGILTICLSGTAESFEPLVLATLIFLHYKFKKERKISNYSILGFCFLLNVICMSFALSGGGTHARIAADISQSSISVRLAMLRAFESVGYYYALWLSTPANILGMLIFTSMFRPPLPDFVSSFSSGTGKVILRIIFIAVLTSMAIYLPSLYLESDAPMPRITMLVFMIFAFSVFASLLSAAGFLTRLHRILQGRFLSHLLWPVFFLSVICSRNFVLVSADLVSGTAFRFNQEQNKRYYDLRNCPADTCYIDSLKNWPVSLERNPREKSVSNPLLYWDIYFSKKRIVIK